MGPLPRSSVALVALAVATLAACGEPFAAAEAGAGGASSSTSSSTGTPTATGAGGAGQGGAGHGGGGVGGHAPGGGGPGGGGRGGAPQCSTSAECGVPGPCVAASCEGGVCVETPTPSETPLPPSFQAKGDCVELRCDGAGSTVSAPDATDVPSSDPGSCVVLSCDGGKVTEAPAPAGTPCSNKRECDGKGACVACYEGGLACVAPETCENGQCVPPACQNGVKDGGETDVDCGGKCALCPDGKACAGPDDCNSHFCSVALCVPCKQHVDCAGDRYCAVTGACTPKKPLGVACAADAECEKGACADGVCCDQKCDGPCRECTSQPGTCKVVGDGAPDPGCPAAAPSTCGNTGLCAGGACALVAQGVLCASTCTNGIKKTTTCDGAGACAFAGLNTQCAPYACAGDTCATSCTGVVGCAPTAYCDAASTCKAKKANGVGCTVGNQCSSGHCVGNVCCSEAGCGAGATCASGSCACKAGFLDCDGKLGCEVTDTTSNNQHCGACGVTCAGARYECVQSQCRDFCAPAACKTWLGCNGSVQCYGNVCGAACP